MQKLINGFDVYVNDAFGASHRAHASIVGPPQFLPSAAGRLLAREVDVLLGLRDEPRRPFVAVLGGSKVSDKLGVIDALLEIVDELVIGGGMCFTFLAAQGHHIGDSLCEQDQIETCRRLLEQPKPIHLPSDVTALGPGDEVRQAGVDLPDGWKGLDIGPGSAAAFSDVILDARTVFWNGPMGVFEDDRFAGRNPHGRASDRRHEGVHGRRRRRQRRRARAVRPGRRRRLDLHRRRRIARAARARRPSGPASIARGTMSKADARKPLISGNWKMHHNHFEAIQTVQKLAFLLAKDDYDAVDVSVHPPFTDLRSVQITLADQKATDINLGAQNCHWEDKGAFTGEISPAFLAKLDCTLRDRRPLRTAPAVRRDRRDGAQEGAGDPAPRDDADPVRGETLEEREAGTTEAKVVGQVEQGLAGLKAEQVAGLVVAYEPIWAIGTGRTATPDDAQAVCALIRSTIAGRVGAETAASVRIQYGGSVKSDNIAELMAQPDIDGALVGGASLDADEFARIVQYRQR